MNAGTDLRVVMFFEDAEQQPMLRMYYEVDWKDVKAYCERAARKLARTLAGLH